MDPNLEKFLKTINKSKFNTASFVKRVEKPWGYELHWVPENKPYMGKVMHFNAGCRFSMQIHDQKQESWFLIRGKAKIIWDNSEGELVETEMEEDKGYTCQVNQRHRLVGITDCDIMEVSTPEMGTTYRLDDDYKRPNETPEIRKKEREEK